MIESILVPVDGSEPSRKALDFACCLALKFNADLSLIYVVEATDADQSLFMGTAHVTVSRVKEETLKTGKSIINAATDIAKQHGCDIKNRKVASGSAVNSILEYAESHNVDTVVMGSRGLGNVAGLLLGSVSHKVAHLAKCTCITVR